jgi:hypothetical protein
MIRRDEKMNLLDITEELRSWFDKQARRRNSAVHTLRASLVGDPYDCCLYNAVYDREKKNQIDNSVFGFLGLEITMPFQKVNVIVSWFIARMKSIYKPAYELLLKKLYDPVVINIVVRKGRQAGMFI